MIDKDVFIHIFYIQILSFLDINLCKITADVS